MLKIGQARVIRFFELVMVFSFSLATAFLTSVIHHPVSDIDAVNSKLGLSIQPILQLNLSTNNLAFNLSPNAFNEANTTINVNTNNLTGYTLTISDQDNDTSLTHQSVNSKKIESIDSMVVKNSFPINRYGYSMDGLNYLAIPRNGSPRNLKKTDTPGPEALNLRIGGKVDEQTLSGQYLNNLTLSVVANYVPNNLFTITTMQEMTPQVCEDTTTPTAQATEVTLIDTNDTNKVPEKTLVDIRDNKNYKVRKLADGNCWMVENLALELGPSVLLKPEDTNINNSWSAEYPTVTELTYGGQSGTLWNSQGTALSYKHDDSSGTKHGVLYNWYAATAQTDGAFQSICPKGWELPRIRGSLAQSGKSLKELMMTYDIGTDGGDPNTINKIKANPLNFTSSGSIYYLGPSLFMGNGMGGVWSNHMYGDEQAYVLTYDDFNGVKIFDPPSAKTARGGYSVRCLANKGY